MTTAVPAVRPPLGLPGLNPEWSRLVTATSGGVARTWHVLGTGPSEPVGTLLCVHGNPTWSYTFRSVVAAAADRWRVVAPDHLEMGYSERTGTIHRLSDRVAELNAVTQELELVSPVVVVAHDWGGPIALSWALAHPTLVGGIVLLNTAVAQPKSKAPMLIRLVRSPKLLQLSTQRTSAFLRGTLRLARPQLPKAVAAAYRAPYASASSRQGIADFVSDIPIESSHQSRSSTDSLRGRLPELRNNPTLLLWGPHDPVFGETYLADLQRLLPTAQTHRFEGAGHLVVEDAPVAEAIRVFADQIVDRPWASAADGSTVVPSAGGVASNRSMWSGLEERADDETDAVVEMGRRGVHRFVGWSQLHLTVTDLAAGLSAVGVAPGDRVALLVPPGIDLTAVLYGCWRAGAVPVLADAGLGLSGLRRALRGANVAHVVGTATTLAAAKAMGLDGNAICVGFLPPGVGAALGVDHTLLEITEIGRGRPLPAEPPAQAEAAVVFTSGATGPAKGVVYRHSQLCAQRDLIRATFGVSSDDRLVAAFAPFALLGPALSITSVVPHMDVTKPGTLTARSLAEAVSAIDATMVFAAPAALSNVIRTARALRQRNRDSLRGVRLLLSAGAPVSPSLLRQCVDLLDGCEAHTPYGMTEALPVCDVTLDELEQSGLGNGVLVGQPVGGVQIALSALSELGEATGGLTDSAWMTGEVCVRGPHVKDHYDQLWSTEQQSSRDAGWHRTGDVGHLDEKRRLWIEGRLSHLVTTAQGVVTPVGIEQRVEALPEVQQAAVVGVGAPGCEVIVVVVEAPAVHPGLASVELLDAVREAARVEVSSVLVVRSLPVDIRHNSKIDRSRVNRWAAKVLSGGARSRL